MFGLFKKNKKEKKLNFVAPISGKAINLSEVPDPVFAQKMVGDGLGIDSTGDIIVAPCDGEITLIFKTKHAFAMTLDNGIEIIVHIGIETVSLNGEGFEQLIEQGTKVKAGTPIIKIDRELIKNKGLSLITPVLITNPDIVRSIDIETGIDVIAGKSVVLTYNF